MARYAPGVGFQNLGRPGSNTGVFGVNSRGVVVGAVTGIVRAAYRYDDGVGFSSVATGTFSAGAYAISDSGFITGETDSRAFIYSPGQGVTYLGSGASVGYAVNESGQVAGFGVVNSRDRAFVYTPGGGVQYLSVPGAGHSYGRGINDAGQVLLDSLTGGLGANGAYVYTPGSGYALLARTANVQSRMHDINNRGWVVGDLDEGGMLWLPGEALPINLTNYVRQYFGPTYTITNANAVNEVGQIVGTATDATGRSAGFILTIPGPGTAWVAGVAALGVRVRRRRTAAPLR